MNKFSRRLPVPPFVACELRQNFRQKNGATDKNKNKTTIGRSSNNQSSPWVMTLRKEADTTIPWPLKVLKKLKISKPKKN